MRQRQERTEWHRIVIFGDGLSGIVEQYLKKGSKVYLEGALQTRKWTDQSGQDKYTTEIVLQPYNGKLIMLDGAGAQNRNGNGGHADNSAGDFGDEVPF